MWTDATKQQFHCPTGTGLLSLMNDISDKESSISADEYVNVLHDVNVNVLKDCSITNYIRGLLKKLLTLYNDHTRWNN